LNISPSWLSLVLPGIALLAFSGGLLLRGLGQGALQSRLQGGETFAFVLGQQRGEERRQVAKGLAASACCQRCSASFRRACSC